MLIFRSNFLKNVQKRMEKIRDLKKDRKCYFAVELLHFCLNSTGKKYLESQVDIIYQFVKKID